MILIDDMWLEEKTLNERSSDIDSFDEEPETGDRPNELAPEEEGAQSLNRNPARNQLKLPDDSPNGLFESFARNICTVFSFDILMIIYDAVNRNEYCVVMIK